MPMDSQAECVNNVPADIWQLIFDHLAGDYESLCNVALTCGAWRSLSESSLFKIVDISCHNNDPVQENGGQDAVLPVIYADLHAGYRPLDLVPRQLAFLATVSFRPHLARHVKTLVWTSIPKDRKNGCVAAAYLKTWPVFASMKNVTRLDLAFVHEMDDAGDYSREVPGEIFPKTTELRLGGTMHRGLVKTIIASLDASKLRSLDVNLLQDEGAMADGEPMSADVALQYAPHAKRSQKLAVVNEELFHRQETGKACIFPGPMWYPLRLLSTSALDALSRLEIKLMHFDVKIDLRNYCTLFDETAKVILKTKSTLNSLTIVFGESKQHYKDTKYNSACGTQDVFFGSTYRPWCVTMATAFLDKILLVLNNQSFPRLVSVRFEGFRFLEKGCSRLCGAEPWTTTLHSIKECPISNASFTDLRYVDYRWPFLGLECAVPNLEGMRTILESS